MLPSATSLFDASPIPTSSYGPPPPTGTYALSLGTPEAAQCECLQNQTYSLAWSCDIPTPQSLGISIENPPTNSVNELGACLLDTSASQGYSNISYGTQTPATSFSPFIAVKDNDDPQQGPALYFQAFYDKVVVAAPDAFPYGQSTSKRRRGRDHVKDAQSFRMPPAWHTRHQIVAGEQPWFCYWNGTFIEGFIYAKNTTAGSASSASSSSSSSSPTSGPFTSTSTILEVSGPHTTSTVTGSGATATSWTSSVANVARGYVGDYYGQLPQLDYIVKIEERRAPGSPQPYCQKMQILNDGTAGAVSDPDTGSPIKILLGEEDPPYSAYQSSSASSSSKIKRADTTPGGCHCQWWSGL